MTYPTYPAATGRQPRPKTVTVSTYLLWLAAAISLIGAVLTGSMVGRMTEVYRELYAGTDAEGSEAVIVGASVIGVVINILFAAALAILAVFNNRGRNGARITTWVIGGISLCCGGLGLAATALTSSMNLDSSTGTGPTPSEVERRLNEALPSWYTPLSTTLSVLTLLSILGAVILLALPSSNAFFRKPAAAGWDPSRPYPYPGGPPPYPTYPQQGQQPPYPAYPGQSPGPGAPPPYGGPSSAPPSFGPPSSGPGEPHTGSIPPTDPWGRPPGDDQRPPSDPTSRN